ncbi:nuclear transport factor 2 family protein [Streptomyces sp. NPDC048291]|uniref:nuclear transport factor 2 family protein n=1 Tax=Streptomyces sp. NPDC048291 TaxID=3365530 RepID=UPI0037171571
MTSEISGTAETASAPERRSEDGASQQARAALRALAERYAVALDLGDREGYLAVFTEDAVVAVHGPDGSPTQERRGAAEIVKEFDDLAGFDRVFHLVGGHVADIAEDNGTATAVVSAEAHHYSPSVDGDATDLYCPVRYHDTCVRTGRGWRISRREVFPLWYEARTVTAPRR